VVSTSIRPVSCAARRAASVLWAALLLGLASSLVLSPGAGAARHLSRTQATLVLDDQTQWVSAPAASSKRATQSSTFDLALSAHHAPAGAAVEVALYPRLVTRYDFENVVHDGPRGNPLATTSPAALSSLPPDAHPAGVSLDLAVVQTASSGQGSELGLGCAPPTGSGTCTGVYPVVVELQRPNGHVLRRLTTFLTYVSGKSSHPLLVSWVVPVAAPVSLAAHPSAPTRAILPLSTAEASSLETLVAQLRAAPTVPLTLDVSPETLQALDGAGAYGRSAVSTVAAMSADPATDEVLARPYAPIDLGALAGAGEPTEIGAQMAAGATVLRRYHVRTVGGASPWVQSGPVGNDIAGGLAQIGATRLVVPKVALAPTSSATNSGTWASTFTLGLSHGKSIASVDAAETDTWLDGQFTSVHGDPALAATQLLADLAMVHFERPNTTSARGMIAIPPARWVADPVFDRVLLGGLTQNPVVQPVTLSRFFATVASAGSRQLLRSGPGPVLKHALADAVSRARVRLSNFDHAVAHHPAVEAQLDDLLLASESTTLGPARQTAGVSAVEQLLTAQLHLVTFATEKTFTLTARNGWIPITVESKAPYTFVGTLSVSGNKFVFPRHGARRTITLDHVTNPTRVYVEARSSGDLPLHVAFTSRDDGLVIARTLLTVRSTATSLVGVVLTAVALAILLTWWARTWWSGRRRRRAGHAGYGRHAGSAGHRERGGHAGRAGSEVAPS
jgi:hypothetical protein